MRVTLILAFLLTCAGVSMSSSASGSGMGFSPAPVGPQQFGVLQPLSQELLAALSQQKPAGAQRVRQIGLGRPLDRQVELGAGAGEAVPGRGLVAHSALIASPGARGMRIHLRALRLDGGAGVVLFDANRPDQASQVVTAAELNGRDELWSDTVFSDAVMVQLQASEGVQGQKSGLVVDQVSQIYAGAFEEIPQAASCYRDRACYGDYATEASAVARMAYTANGNTYVCTGTLLAGPNNSPYFLTAHHCIPDQALASTIELYWFYEAPSCGGTAPALDSVPRTRGGADLLAVAADSDFSFMRLRQSPPGNAARLKWSLEPPQLGDTLVCIHHPDGTPKRLNVGKLIGTQPAGWGVQWQVGATEEGSSGAPLLNSRGEVLGQLDSGFNGPGSSCADPSQPDRFGRFDVTFASIAKWLQPSYDGNLFQGPKGTYQGLFYVPSQGLDVNSAGSITMTLSAKGKFSGKLQFAGGASSFKGVLDKDGLAEVAVKRRAGSPLTLRLQLPPDDVSQLGGSVSDGNWTASIFADRAAYDGKLNPSPLAGRYTWALPGDPGNSGSVPGGDGYATVTVDRAGKIKLSGALADGTKISRSMVASPDSQAPMFVPLYHGKGFVGCWLTVANSGSGGEVTWVCPGGGSKLYPGGFALAPDSQISSFVPATPILDLPEGTVWLAGGGLDAQSSFNLLARNRVTALGPGKLSLSFSGSNGTFKGALTPEGSPKASFRGVVLQNQGIGRGYFLNEGQSGEAVIGN